jgi:hypothetical protein
MPGCQAGPQAAGRFIYFNGLIMTNAFKVGDKVQWHSPQGTVTGTIKKKLTSPTEIKGHHVAASADNPEYLVVSDKTGAEAAHRPDALKKV